jgi:AraC-like DNA-binding protein
MSYVYIGCSALIAFIISLISGKKKKVLPDFLLIVWLLILGINMVTFFILDAHHEEYPNSLPERILIEFTDASVFLHGPIFLVYTFALSQVTFKLSRKYLLHLIPFILSFLFLTYSAVTGAGQSYHARMWLTLLKMISVFLYTVSVIIQLRKHRKLVENIYSNTEEKNLSWVNFLSWGILMVWLISLISLLVNLSTLVPLNPSIRFLPNLSLCLFIYFMGYFGVRQTSIFVTRLDPDFVSANIEKIEHEEAGSTTERKYKKSGLNHEKADKLFTVLSEYMETKKPFLNPEISLFDLAKLLKVLPNHLSQVINVKTDQNFFDYINFYRVNKVKEYILNGRLGGHNLLGLAIDSGFNSKASFNRAFKRHTGLTPSEFKSLHLKK